jgi:hypothetical protein
MTAMICRISALSLAAALLALASAGCDPVVDVSGTVHNQAGVPLEGVVVTLTMPKRVPDTVKTAKDGSFVVGLIGADPLKTRISFQKDGYKKLEQPVGKEERVTVEITLLPDSR